MASSRIKGITIEIGGDTTKLQKALSGVDKSLRKTQNELRDINKLLKVDPGNTELLRQKQSALTREIQLTADKLEKEKAALKAAADQNIPDEQQAALKREVIATEQQLESLKKEMKSFGNVAKQKLDTVGNKFQSVGDKISGVGQNLLPVTAGVAALGAGSIAAFNEVDTGLDTVTKKTGASGEALEEMQQIVKELPTEFNTSFESAGEAVGEVNTRFGLTGKELKDLSAQFLKFAQLNDTDVTGSVDGVQKALAAFGLDATHASSLLDTLTAVSQKTGVSVEDLQNNLVTNSATFQELGLSIEQATAFMGQAEMSGANYTAVVSGLRKALKKATEEGVPFDEALQNLQSTIKDGTGDVDGLTMAYDLFGKSGDQIYQAVQQGTIDFEALAGTIEDVGGTVTDTFESTQDPTDDFMTALNGVKQIGAEVGGTLLTSLTPVLEKLGETIKKVSEWWSGLSEEQQNFILKIAGVVAAIGPALMIFGKMSSGIGAVIKIVGALIGVLTPAAAATAAEGAAATAATPAIAASGVAAGTSAGGFGALSAALLPIALIIAGIIAAIIAIIAIIKNWDKIVNALRKTWESFSKAIKAIWEGIKRTAGTIWNGIKEAVLHPVETAKKRVGEMVENIKNFFEFTGLKKKVGEAWESIKNKITGPIEDAKALVDTAVSKIKGFFPISMGKIFSGIKLPHFKISGGKAPWGIMGMGVKPSIDIEWYAKAMRNGMILNSPTIFGASGSHLLGAGETGSEAIVGTSSLSAMIQNSVTAALTSMSATIANATYRAVLAAMEGGGRPVEANLYLFKNSPQMGKWIVDTYDTYKARLG